MLYRPFILLFYFLPCNDQTMGDGIVRITVPEVNVYAGKNAEINVFVSVKKGYHIQANKVNDEFLIPTILEIDTQEILMTGKQVFPESKKFKLEGTSDYLLVYDGSFKITISFKTVKKIKKGKYNLAAKLRYQACDAKTCFSPKKVSFPVIINAK